MLQISNKTLDLDPTFYIKLEEWKRPAFTSTSFPIVIYSASRFPDI